MRIISISKDCKSVTVPPKSPQHWSTCLIAGNVHTVLDTKRVKSGIVFQLDRPTSARIGDTVAACAFPNPFYPFFDALEVAADYDLPVAHMFGLGARNVR